MRRLDSAFSTSSSKWMIYIFLTFMWGITIKGLAAGDQNHRERAIWFLYFLLPLSVIALWWLSGFKQVTLAGDTLIIRDSRREARVPISQVERIGEYPWIKGLEYIALVFKSPTEFGRRVRIMIGERGEEFDRIAKLLRGAMEGEVVGVKIHEVPRESRPIPHQKEVTVSGWSREELSGILTDFADSYSGDLGSDFNYEVCPDDKSSARITFPHDIPATQFSFLINYLQYPKNYDLKSRSISVVGKASLSPDFHPPDGSFVGQKAVFYVPANDKDYDLVYVRVGGETFANSFATRHWKKVEDPRLPAGVEIS